MLKVSSVAHSYDGTPALAAVDFSLTTDEPCLVTGPQGAGKTTLLCILAGILPPTGGQVGLDGHALYRPDRRDDRWRARRIGLIPQKLLLIEALSALDNVELAHFFAARSGTTSAARATLASLGITTQLGARPAQLSADERRRVAIARATVNRPLLLLADEPTAELDDEGAHRAIGVLLDAARHAKALLVVATRDARIGDRFSRTVALEPAT